MFDDHTMKILMNGKIQIGKKQISLNILELYQSFAIFTSSLLKSGSTTGNNLSFTQINLKALVEDLSEGEDIFTGYLMTF